MKTQKQLIEKFGNPYIDNISFERKWMTLWDIPQSINTAIPALPNKMYVNKILVPYLDKTFLDLISKNLHKEIKTYDGCFNIRKKRGLSTFSLHSFGLAIDLNAAWNQLGKPSTWSKEFVDVWRNNGWICGADWTGRKDSMHFQGDNFI